MHETDIKVIQQVEKECQKVVKTHIYSFKHKILNTKTRYTDRLTNYCKNLIW